MVKMEDLVKEIIIQNNIPYYRIESRMDEQQTKTGEHVYIPAIRVITYFEDTVTKISEVLSSEFDVNKERSIDKKKLRSDNLSYKQVQYVAALKQERQELTEYKRLGTTKFEIQVCSMLQDAWSGIEKELGYDNATFPEEMKRDFYRVGALLEMADLEFLKIRSTLSSQYGWIDQGEGQVAPKAINEAAPAAPQPVAAVAQPVAPQPAPQPIQQPIQQPVQHQQYVAPPQQPIQEAQQQQQQHYIPALQVPAEDFIPQQPLQQQPANGYTTNGMPQQQQYQQYQQPQQQQQFYQQPPAQEIPQAYTNNYIPQPAPAQPNLQQHIPQHFMQEQPQPVVNNINNQPNNIPYIPQMDVMDMNVNQPAKLAVNINEVADNAFAGAPKINDLVREQTAAVVPPAVINAESVKAAEESVALNIDKVDTFNMNVNGMVERRTEVIRDAKLDEDDSHIPFYEREEKPAKPAVFDENAQMTDDTLKDYVIKSKLVKEVDAEVARRSGATLNSDVDVEGDVERLKYLKVFSIKQLHERIQDNKNDIVAFAEKWIGSDNGGSFDSGICLFYLEYLLVGKKNDPAFAVEYVLKFISDNDYSARFIIPTYNSISKNGQPIGANLTLK